MENNLTSQLLCPACQKTFSYLSESEEDSDNSGAETDEEEDDSISPIFREDPEDIEERSRSLGIDPGRSHARLRQQGLLDVQGTTGTVHAQNGHLGHPCQACVSGQAARRRRLSPKHGPLTGIIEQDQPGLRG